jgi:hypothetical protein
VELSVFIVADLSFLLVVLLGGYTRNRPQTTQRQNSKKGKSF